MTLTEAETILSLMGGFSLLLIIYGGLMIASKLKGWL